MKTILITAFGNFGNYLANSTELVATKFEREPPSEYKIIPMIFECNIPDHQKNRGQAILKTAEKIKASAIISLGMASEKTGLCIEISAKNRIFCPKYCPDIAAQVIDQDLTDESKLDLNLSPWQLKNFYARCDNENISLMDLSQDAGGFCCNHLMWQTRSLQLKELQYTSIPFIFFHIPCSPECVKNPEEFALSGKTTMSVEQVIKGLKILLSVANFPL